PSSEVHRAPRLTSGRLWAANLSGHGGGVPAAVPAGGSCMRDVITNRLCPRVTCVRAAALLAVCGVLASGGCGSGSSAGAGPSAVRGRYLVTLCDADPPADIGGGFLVERNPASRDALTVVALPIREPVTP